MTDIVENSPLSLSLSPSQQLCLRSSCSAKNTHQSAQQQSSSSHARLPFYYQISDYNNRIRLHGWFWDEFFSHKCSSSSSHALLRFYYQCADYNNRIRLHGWFFDDFLHDKCSLELACTTFCSLLRSAQIIKTESHLHEWFLDDFYNTAPRRFLCSKLRLQ